MGAEPFLTICIPAYNARGVIGGCLESLAAQVFDDYEVVIADDGSDEPLELGCGELAGLDARRLRIVRQENGGTYAARQRAIGEARGRYVFCMDADDALANSGVLARIARALEANSFPDVLLVNAAREDGTACVDYSGLADGAEIGRASCRERV